MRSSLALLPLSLFTLASVACGAVDARETQPHPKGDPDDVVVPPPPTCPSVELAALPERLSGTGLFVDVETDEVNPCVKAFEPRFWLWTDGADKRRFVYLPSIEGDRAVIDDTNPDTWELPVGTRLWKEFSRDGVRVETRVMWRTSTGWLHGAYVWGDDGDAVLQSAGVTDARGTTHDVPEAAACTMCHGEGSEMRPLGFSALQLAHDLPGVTFASLVDEGRIRARPAPRIPGDPLDVEVLGWLHVNCGSCHRDGGLMQDYALRLALRGDEATLADTGVMRTAVGQAAMGSPLEDVQTLIFPGAPEESLVFVRANTRDGAAGVQMPPLGTEIVDEAGLSRLNDWIVRLAP